MRNSPTGKHPVADMKATHIELRFYPYAHETQAVLVLARGLGDRASRVRVWAGFLPCRRSALRGMGTGQVAFLLAGLLRDALDAEDERTIAAARDSGSAGGLGIPLGITGGTVIQDPLPIAGGVF